MRGGKPTKKVYGINPCDELLPMPKDHEKLRLLNILQENIWWEGVELTSLFMEIVGL